MNDAHLPEEPLGQPTREEFMSALFASMVIQQTNMGMMMLGKMPHPETGETFLELESARMFIEQLEMLAVKTKGNLDRREEGLLKQSLHTLHMAFVSAVDAPEAGTPPTPLVTPAAAPELAQPAAAPQPVEPVKSVEPARTAVEPAPAPVAAPAPPAEDESRKRFTKKY